VNSERTENIMLYCLSDTHLSFTTDKPMNVFGRNWDNHEKQIEKNWIETVTAEDTVVVAGDISWGMNFEEARQDLLFLNSLPGHKIILKGNHDYWWATANKMNAFFAENGIDKISILYNNAYYREGKIICGTRGWINEFGVKTEDERIIKREAQRLALSLDAGLELKKEHPDAEILVFMHYPPVFGDFINYDVVDVLYRYGVEKVYYGHLHNVRKEQLDDEYIGIQMYLTSCDYLGFRPLKIQ